MQGYRSVQAPSETEFTINRSRFIGRCLPVESEDEARAILSDIRKKHWDASHHCFAYRIGREASPARYSDDGEPAGTAGLPIMGVLSSRGLTDVLCVVTRYFGGILLGSGGLVRAYSKSAADAVSAAGAVSFIPARRMEITVDYSLYGAVEAYMRSAAQVDGVEFADKVRISLSVAEDGAEAFKEEIMQRTGGRSAPADMGRGWLKIAEI